MIRGFTRDLGKYLPSYIVPGIVGIIAVPIITRLFPPEDYGDYILVKTTISILSAVGASWLSASIIRFFSACQLNDRLAEFYSTVIKLALLSVGVISFVGLGGLLLVQDYVPLNLWQLMRVGLLVFIGTSFYNIFLSILRAKRRVNWYSSLAIWRSVIGLGFGVMLVVCLRRGVDGLLWGSLLSMVVIFPLIWKISRGKPSSKARGIHRSLALEMIRYGLPVILANLASWIIMLSDRYVLEFFRGSTEVGVYSAAYAIPQGSIFVIASMFSLSAMPIGVSIWEAYGRKKSQEFLSKLMRYYLIIGLPAMLGLSVLSKPIMHVLTAPAYFSGHSVIPFIAFSGFLAGISTIWGMPLNYAKKTNLIMLCNLVCAVLNLGLNFCLISKYGFIAAAATTLIAFTADLIMKIVVSKHFLTWVFPFKSLGRGACASAVMGVAVYIIGNRLTASNLINVIVGIGVGVVIYFIVLVLLHEFHSEEVAEVRRWASKIRRCNR